MSVVIIFIFVCMFTVLVMAGIWYVSNSTTPVLTFGDPSNTTTTTGTAGGVTTTKVPRPISSGPGSYGPWSSGPESGMLGITLNGKYRVYLGAGGCIARMLGRKKQDLLGPSLVGNQNAEHDRTIQTVTWSENRAPSNIPLKNDFEYRYNPNQCGGWNPTAGGGRTPTYSEIKGIDKLDGGAIQIWAMVRDQFTHQIQHIFKTTIPMLTRYTPIPQNNPTALLIEQFICYGPVEQQGQGILAQLNDVYMENWCAFRGDAFSRVALGGISSTGQEINARDASALPYYPQIPASSITTGNIAILGSECVGIGFHVGAPGTTNCGYYKSVIALMPAANVGDVPRNTIVTKSLVVGIAETSAQLGPIMAAVKPSVKPTLKHPPSATSVPGLSASELQKLRTLAQETTAPADAASRKTWQLARFL